MKLRSTELAVDPVYSTKTIKEFYDLTNKGLFFYEEKGIIHPAREKENDYRVYSTLECNQLYTARVLRNFQFSLDETVDIMKMNLGEHREALQNKQKTYDYEITKLQILKQKSTYIQHMIQLIEEDQIPWTIVRSPSFHRVEIQRSDSNNRTKCLNIDEYKSWCSATPLTGASIVISGQSLMSDKKQEYGLGFITESENMDFLQLPKTDNVEKIEPMDCIYTIIHAPAEDLFSKRRFMKSKQRLLKEGWELTGNPFTRMIGNFMFNGITERFDEAWFPIGRKDDI